MHLFGLAESTQAIYLTAVIRLRDYYQQSPAQLSNEQIKAYLLHLKNKPLAPNTYNTHNTQIYGLRFFYVVTLRRPLCKKMGVSEGTFYNWKKRYAGLTGMKLRQLKQLEEENKQLNAMFDFFNLLIFKRLMPGVVIESEHTLLSFNQRG